MPRFATKPILLPTPFAELQTTFESMQREIWLEIERSMGFVTVITTAYTAADERVIYVDDDTASGAVTITLPPVASSKHRVYTVKKLGTTGNVTLDGNGSETIDGATTLALTSQYEATTVHCEGSAWYTIA